SPLDLRPAFGYEARPKGNVQTRTGDFMHRIVARLIPLALVILVAPETFAQGVTGSAVTGTVKKTTGEPLDGVALQLRNPANGDTFNAVSERGGKYTIHNVPPPAPSLP